MRFVALDGGVGCGGVGEFFRGKSLQMKECFGSKGYHPFKFTCIRFKIFIMKVLPFLKKNLPNC